MPQGVIIPPSLPHPKGAWRQSEWRNSQNVLSVCFPPGWPWEKPHQLTSWLAHPLRAQPLEGKFQVTLPALWHPGLLLPPLPPQSLEKTDPIAGGQVWACMAAWKLQRVSPPLWNERVIAVSPHERVLRWPWRPAASSPHHQAPCSTGALPTVWKCRAASNLHCKDLSALSTCAPTQGGFHPRKTPPKENSTQGGFHRLREWGTQLKGKASGEGHRVLIMNFTVMIIKWYLLYR